MRNTRRVLDLYWNYILDIFTFHHRLHGFTQILINYETHISVNIDVIQSVAKNLENIPVDILVHVTEILPPFGRLNDKLCQEIYRSLNYLSVTICVICGEFKHPFTFFYASIVPPTSASPHIRSECKV